MLDLVRFHGERSVIPLTNFYGIEIKSFAAEIARLALLIAEFQCDVNFIGQKEARDMVLPLDDTGRIKIANALRVDWLEVCPPSKQVSVVDEDPGGPTGRLALDATSEPEVETFICGNPPYSGKGKLSADQKKDMETTFKGRTKHWGYIDYVGCWFLKGSDYCRSSGGSIALVSTNSIHMGRQAPTLWLIVLVDDVFIRFAHTSFPWSNNATKNAAVICVIVGCLGEEACRRTAGLRPAYEGGCL